MANVKVEWVLPATRESGKPLAVTDIKHVAVEISADGVNYAAVGAFPPDVLETTVQDVDFGEWFFRAACVDTKDRASDWTAGGILIEDTTPPTAPTLVLSLV